MYSMKCILNVFCCINLKCGLFAALNWVFPLIQNWTLLIRPHPTFFLDPWCSFIFQWGEMPGDIWYSIPGKTFFFFLQHMVSDCFLIYIGKGLLYSGGWIKQKRHKLESPFKRRPLLYNAVLILPANTRLESNSWHCPCKRLLYCNDRYEVLLLIWLSGST